MQATKTKAENGTLKVIYTFLPEEYILVENSVLKKMAAKSNASGFRKGKVPLTLIKSQMAPEQLAMDIMLGLVDQALKDQESHDIDYIGRPEVLDFKDSAKDASASVEISFILKPKVTLPDYKKKSQDKKWAINKEDDDKVISEKISNFFDQISQDSKIEIPEALINDVLKQHEGHNHDEGQDHSHDINHIKDQIHRDLVFAAMAEELEVKIDDQQLMALFSGFNPNKKKAKVDKHNYENFKAAIIWQMFSGKVRDLLLVDKDLKEKEKEIKG